MKVISPIFSSMRGKLGGAVGSVSRGGVQYMRSLVIPSNPRSPYQTAARLVMTAIAAAWTNTLTGLQRAGWTSIAEASSSGIDAYVKSNSIPMLTGAARLDDAPDSLSLEAAVVVAAPTVDASAHTIVTATAEPTAVDYAVFISAPQPASRAAQEHPFTYAGTGATVTLPSVHPAYNLVAGDIVYVRYVQFGTPLGVNAGKVATEQIFRVIVVA